MPASSAGAKQRHERLARTSGKLALGDLLTGQLSVRAGVFAAANGFDEAFNADGSFGAEDTDFLHRLLQSGAVVSYAAGAVTWQRYVVTPDQYLRQWRQGGRADAVLARKHPALAPTLAEQHGAGTLPAGSLSRWAPAVPSRVGRALAAYPVARAPAPAAPTCSPAGRSPGAGRSLLEGPARAGRLAGRRRARRARLPRHRGRRRRRDRRLVRGARAVRAAVDAMTAAGFRFIGLGDLLAARDAAPLPPRPALLTFDDAYASLLTSAAPYSSPAGSRPSSSS